jgi:hypothetical protein
VAFPWSRSPAATAVKNLIAGAFGVMLATVGQTSPRGGAHTFGISFTEGSNSSRSSSAFALILSSGGAARQHSALARLNAVRPPAGPTSEMLEGDLARAASVPSARAALGATTAR